MMSAVRTRRQSRSLASDRKAARATSSEYDDNRLRIEEPLEEMPGRDLTANWADIDDADDSDLERAVELAGAYVVGEDVFVAVAPKRADEFWCSSCFLIHHMSRLASSKGCERICTDCA